jgi:hypothetical protein
MSPVNSFEPDFLKVPMVAMLKSPFFVSSPHHAASMAIDRPEATDDASLATEAKRRMARARFSCFARNG